MRNNRKIHKAILLNFGNIKLIECYNDLVGKGINNEDDLILLNVLEEELWQREIDCSYVFTETINRNVEKRICLTNNCLSFEE